MPDELPNGRNLKSNATDFLFASKKCEILSLESYLKMGELVVSISNLVHALQRERGGSNLYLGSAGGRYGEHLAKMTADTDRQVQGLDQALAKLDTEAGGAPGDSRLLSRIACAVHALSEIDFLRARVKRQALKPDDAISVYTELVRSLLAIVFKAADTAMDPTISRILVAMFNFMQGKELAGQERAVGAAGFSRGQFEPELIERMQHLTEAQERCFEIFADFADQQALQAWRSVRESPDQSELTRLRRMAGTTDLEGRQRITVDKSLGERWFWLATARIDAMKTVEDQLVVQLHQLCEQRLAEARDALTRQQTLIESLDYKGEEPDDSFIVFCGATSDAGQQDAYRTDGVAPRLGRSIIDLVQSQAQRLQEMNDELNAAREALEERKVMDRAKLLLMKHRNMTEEEAYRLLRQTAMNQSRRLADVARAMVAIGEVWAKPDGESNRS